MTDTVHVGTTYSANSAILANTNIAVVWKTCSVLKGLVLGPCKRTCVVYVGWLALSWIFNLFQLALNKTYQNWDSEAGRLMAVVAVVDIRRQTFQCMYVNW